MSEKTLAQLIKNSRAASDPPYTGSLHGIDLSMVKYNLSANENIFGASSLVKQALGDFFANCHSYPDDNCTKLKQQIAELDNSNPEQIIVGAGSNELLSLINKLMLDQNSSVMCAKFSFIMYGILAKMYQAQLVRVDPEAAAKNKQNYKPTNNDKITASNNPLMASAEQFVDSFNRHANSQEGQKKPIKIIFVDNPNNPTGGIWTINEILLLLNNIPKNVIVVVDEAYQQYVKIEQYASAMNLVENFDNLVVTRTFSKIYALAGFRLGYMYASPTVVEEINKLKLIFNVSAIAQNVGAAAMKDQSYIQKIADSNQLLKQKYAEVFAAAGFLVYPSEANFILVDFYQKEKAQEAFREMLSHGVLVRRKNNYNLPCCLRITIGSLQALKVIEKTLKALATHHATKYLF